MRVQQPPRWAPQIGPAAARNHAGALSALSRFLDSEANFSGGSLPRFSGAVIASLRPTFARQRRVVG